LWTRRAERWALPVLAAVSLVTTGWAFAILARSPEWNPWLRWAVLVVGVVAAAGLLLGRRLGTAVLRTGVSLALVAALAGPTAWTVQTVLTPHAGGAVTTGPAVQGADSRGPGGFAGRGALGDLPGRPTGAAAGQEALPDGQPGRGQEVAGQQIPDQAIGGANGTFGAFGEQGTTAVGEAITSMLLKNADSYTWVAATTGAENAARYQLSTERSVMPIGGFSGSDPSPTLAQFQAYVSAGKIHYFIASTSGPGGGGFGGRDEGSSSISTWVSENFTAQTVDGVTIYDLTAPTS